MNVVFKTPGTALLDLIQARLQLTDGRIIGDGFTRKKFLNLGEVVDKVQYYALEEFTGDELRVIYLAARAAKLRAEELDLYCKLISRVDSLLSKVLIG